MLELGVTPLELGVTPITKGAFGAVLASTKVNSPIFLGFESCWSKAAPFVGSITKRLAGAITAGAPVVGLSRFNFHRTGRFLRNVWAAHEKRLSPLFGTGNSEWQSIPEGANFPNLGRRTGALGESRFRYILTASDCTEGSRPMGRE
jgi:hypothetical protein